MLDLNVKLLGNDGTRLPDNAILDFIFRQLYLSECVGRHQTVLIVNVVQEGPTRNTF